MRRDGAKDEKAPSPFSAEELQAATERDSQLKMYRKYLKILEEQEPKLAVRFVGQSLETAQKNNQRELKKTREQIEEREVEVEKELAFSKEAKVVQKTKEQLQADLKSVEDLLKTKESERPVPPASMTASRQANVENLADIAVAQSNMDAAEARMNRLDAQLSYAEMAQAEALARTADMGIRAADTDEQGNAKPYMQDDDDERRKLMQSGASGGAVFFAVAGLIVLLDVRKRKLNDTLDVSERLQINVLGTVPLLRGRGPKRLQQSARLAEAVDGVAATLLCRTSGDDHRVVMISSAMAGEGKTTLAANLATSLASAGRRTLLVDFDLRRPMLHQVYQIPIGPGLGELLSSPDLSEYAEYLRETGTEGLWLIPAGAKRQRAIAELSDARTAELFDAFKEHFEFIIVDGPPVLPVVDTRLVARHADGVVMSLLRDVSELPKVRSACQLLQSYKVRILGGVVIGASGDVYYGEPPERVSNIA